MAGGWVGGGPLQGPAAKEMECRWWEGGRGGCRSNWSRRWGERLAPGAAGWGGQRLGWEAGSGWHSVACEGLGFNEAPHTALRCAALMA